MKITTSVTVFMIFIGVSCANTIELLRPSHQECCKQGFNDEQSQRKCVAAIENQLQDSLVLQNIAKVLENSKIEAVNERKKEICEKEENANKLKDLNDPVAIFRTKNQIYKSNNNDIKAAEEAAKIKTLEELNTGIRERCQKISGEIAKENDPEFFTADLFGYIVAAGFAQYEEKHLGQFIKYLKKYKNDAKILMAVGAGGWQMMYGFNKDLINYIETCNCKEPLFTKEFRKFLEWVYIKRTLDDTIETCSLEEYLSIYKQETEIIKNDPDGNIATLKGIFENCKKGE